MDNIHSIPLYYISFNPSDYIEEHYKIHGFTNVNHFPAIDGRKLNIHDLINTNKITIRVYDDLLSGRKDGAGMPSLGGIGCTLSHSALWQKCLDDNLQYIIITEEDNRMGGILTAEELERIYEIIQKPNGMFLSGNPRKKNGAFVFYGLHFYILSSGACQALLKNCYPIDIQTDSYISNVATRGDITVEGFPISEQYGNFALSDGSSIQNICFICWLPQNKWFYVIVCGIILLIIFLFILYSWKFKNCRKSYASCSESF